MSTIGFDTRPQQIRTALLSVSDKTGLVAFARRLAALDIRLLSTGGTANALRQARLDVIDVSQVTGFPEIMDGRVKTLHPHIHGGILARRDNSEHLDALNRHNITPVDIIVANLYPFAQTVKAGADFETCVENIDIGGPAIIRAAAKNHHFVSVISDPADYDLVAKALEADGTVDATTRQRLAQKAFQQTAAYDQMIADWLTKQTQDAQPEQAEGRLNLSARKALNLRYGENPHQTASLYASATREPSVVQARQIQGNALSYNNINDTDAALRLVCEFSEPAIAIIKHANPCGVAVADSLAAAWEQALAADPVSAFGGIVACNRALDQTAATAISSIFTEVVIAPDADADALSVLAGKNNLRVLLTGQMPDPTAEGLQVKSVLGGYLVQSRDNGQLTDADLKIVTNIKPTDAQLKDMMTAWKIAKHVKSNAIVYVKDGVSAGIGAGQMSRVDSCYLAAQKASQMAKYHGWERPRTKGSVVASDAFFPFADGLQVAIEAGAVAVIQPGGSMRDGEVIAAADEAGIAMAFTGMRNFNH